MGKLILHEFGMSSCSWRIRIALAHKGIPYESQDVEDLDTPEFLRMNPAMHVPVLEVDGSFIAESIAILEYLEETHPEVPLLPQDPIQRAKVREICQVIASGIQPLQHPLVAARHSNDEEKQAEWTSYYIERGFQALEKLVERASADGVYCVGSEMTFADCCLVPQVYNALCRFNVDMKPYPKLLSIYTELMKRPKVTAGCPDNFED